MTIKNVNKLKAYLSPRNLPLTDIEKLAETGDEFKKIIYCSCVYQNRSIYIVIFDLINDFFIQHVNVMSSGTQFAAFYYQDGTIE